MARANKQNLHFTKQTLGSMCLREASMVICLLISLMLVILDSTNSQGLNKVKMSLQSSFASVFSSTAKFTKGIDDFFINFNTVSELNKRNSDLEKDNATLHMWRNKALRFEAENESLKELLKFEEIENYEFQSAQIAINNSASFNRNVVIDAKGLNRNQSIVSAHGLVGRVIEATDTHANVLLITDINSKVPSLVERTRDKAIAVGQNTKQLRLEYLPDEADITVGDRILTSGDGSIFESGLLIGTVTYIEGPNVRIKTSTNFDKIEFVSILKEQVTE